MDSKEHLTLSEWEVRMQSLIHIEIGSKLHNTQCSCTICLYQVFCNVSWQLMLEDKEVLILLEQLGWCLLKAIDQLKPSIAADQVKVKSLSGLILERVIEPVGVFLEDTVDCFLALCSVGCPLATHQTNQA